jgi:tRNAThr (cytosine32-N3)-methyltransferase
MEDTQDKEQCTADIGRFGTRYLTDKVSVWDHNSWDDVSWDKEQLEQANYIIQQQIEHCEYRGDPLDAPQTPSPYDSGSTEESRMFWDRFYIQNDRNFFKDRHWFEDEFPELFNISSDPRREAISILEVGCGAGNSIFPILEGTASTYPNLFITGIDFSEQAIGLVHSDPRYSQLSDRCNAFVFDISKPDAILSTLIKPESVDIILLVFVMSAISPLYMKQAIEKLTPVLKPGGTIFFRDYGQYDMAQLRFKPESCIQPHQYRRGDGTWTFFFTLDHVKSLFPKDTYTEIQLDHDKRLLVNRKRQLKMYRVWIKGRFQKKPL